MKHCYSYNFTNQDCKLFKIKLSDFLNFGDFCNHRSIRSIIDPRSSEFNLDLDPFEECKEVETDKAWFKLLHLLFGFLKKYDVKNEIRNDITRKTITYPNYEKDVKQALASYIILLRTGKYYLGGGGIQRELMKNLSTDDLVDLLKDELLLRATVYSRTDNPNVIVEIADYYWDYDALYKKFGVDLENKEGDAYTRYIEHVTKSENTKRIKNQQAMRAQMYGDY